MLGFVAGRSLSAPPLLTTLEDIGQNSICALSTVEENTYVNGKDADRIRGRRLAFSLHSQSPNGGVDGGPLFPEVDKASLEAEARPLGDTNCLGM